MQSPLRNNLPDENSAEPEYIIGFPEDNMANDWRAAQMREIEEELYQHHDIMECAVIGVPDELFGQVVTAAKATAR